MKKILLGIMFLLPLGIFSQSLEELDKQYDAAKTVDEIDKVAQALSTLLDKNAADYNLNWRMSRAVWAKGDVLSMQYTLQNVKAVSSKNDMDDYLSAEKDFTESQRTELLKYGTDARKYAEKAVAANPNGIEGRYYNALAISMYAQGKTIVSALTEGLRGKFNDELDAALKLNRKYNDGGALRLAGRAAYKLPWPLRDFDKSAKYLKEATEIYPGNLRAWLYLADTYYKTDNLKEAKAAYTRVTQLSPAGLELRDGNELKTIAQMKLNALK